MLHNPHFLTAQACPVDRSGFPANHQEPRTVFLNQERITMSEPPRIVIDPNICHGAPCIRGLRYPVTTILEHLAAGMSFEAILEDYPDLERQDILACLEYAARISDTKLIQAS